MNRKELLNQLQNEADLEAQVQALRQLEFYIDDPHVVHAFCHTLLATRHLTLRTRIMDVMRPKVDWSDHVRYSDWCTSRMPGWGTLK